MLALKIYDIYLGKTANIYFLEFRKVQKLTDFLTDWFNW